MLDLERLRRMAAVGVATVLLLELEEEKRKTKRRYWVHPVIDNREERGQFWAMYNHLREHEDKFLDYMRMSIKTFDELLTMLSIHLQHQDTYFRTSIPGVERLVITLRYLATGQTLASLHYSFLIGKSSASYIVRETCTVIWDVLHDVVMAKPTREEWVNIAKVFEERCNFPNCVGAIDGKHIRIIKPVASGSKFWNYKKYFSFVLLAVADANYCFRYIDVGSYGSGSDSSIFGQSTFGHMLRDNLLDLPANLPMPGTTNLTLPYVFVGDEAFALGEHLMRPYSSRGLTLEKSVFNYRLSRARRMVECTFGILSNKWRFLHTPVNLNLQNAIAAVKAACVLHNYVRQRDGSLCDDAMIHNLGRPNWTATRGNTQGSTVRDQFASYFMSPAGQVPWQMQAAEDFA